MKKKLLALLLAGAMLTAAGTFGIAGCGANETDDGTDKDQIETPDNTPNDSDTDKEQKKPHSHVFDKRVTEGKFLKSEATCTAKAVYHLSCECGEKGAQTFESGAALGHSFTGSRRFDEHSHWQLCERCDLTITAAHEISDNGCGVCDYRETKGLATAPVAGGICVTDIGEVTDEQIFIPSQIDGVPVTAIEKEAFKDNRTITRVVVPDTVTSIGELAFLDCRNLKEFWVYETEPAAKAKTFSAVSRADDSDPSETATVIGDGAFARCEKLTEADIPDGITSIGLGAFFACLYLNEIKFPDTVTTLSNYAFGSCLSLKNTDFGNGLKIIGNAAFYTCWNLQSVIIPPSVTEIGESAFSTYYGYPSELRSVYIPDSVIKIGEDAFGSSDRYRIIYCEAESKPENWDDNWLHSDNPIIWNCKNNDKDENGYKYVLVDDVSYVLKNGEATVAGQKWTLGGKFYDFRLDEEGWIKFESANTIEKIIIPESITYEGESYAVTAIDDFALVTMTNEIELPVSIKKIGTDVFYCLVMNNGYLEIKIKYNGTIEDWLKIEKSEEWYYNADNRITITCTDGKLDKRGNEIE